MALSHPKIIGTLDTKDDADLLKNVLDALPHFDAIFAYNDGSTDETEEILKRHPKITKYVNRSDFPDEVHQKIPQHRRHHLLDMVMKEYHTYNVESVWVVRLESDRYFMNRTPWDIVNLAEFYELEGVAGVMVDCRLPPYQNWNNFDSYPNWHLPITRIQTYGRIDDVHPVVAFKVLDGVKYSISKPRPWPLVWGNTNYRENDWVHPGMAFFAHHGRRGPRYWSKAYGPGGFRARSKKWPTSWNFDTPKLANETVNGIPFRPDGLIPLESVRDEFSFSSISEGQAYDSPYGGPHLSMDINILCQTWNALPPRTKCDPSKKTS